MSYVVKYAFDDTNFIADSRNVSVYVDTRLIPNEVNGADGLYGKL